MQLLRGLGFFHVNMFLFSATIGTGIFVSPKGVLKYCSLNIPIFLSIWAGCGLLSMMNAVCLAEIAATYPVSGASYYFLKRALGSSVAFLSIWIKIFACTLGISAQCLLIASSLIQCFYSECQAPELPKKCLALAILWSFGILSARGIKPVAWFNTISSLMKLSVLCLISLTGIVLLVIGKKENVSRFEKALEAELPNVSQIAEAILQVYYAYLGSSFLIVIAGEIKRPAETIPKSIIYGLSVVTVLYLLTNVSFLAVLTSEEIISSDSVAVTWMNRVFPSMQWIISLLISAFLFGSVSCGIVSASRIFYATSQEGQFPFIYSMLNDLHSPVVADLQAVILSSVGIISSNMIYLIKYVGLGTWCLNLLNMIGLLKLRYQNPDLPRPYKVRLPFVFGSIASSLFLILTPVIQSPSTEHVYQVVFLFCGLLCYWLQAYLNRHGVCFNRITCYWQLLFNVSPSEHPEKLIPSLNPN
ncbi:solute carrier family 7 (cationic amino acid transporter, y+ system), member 12 [Rattus norvegicus]|uniref:Solute carrier family 7 (Cationic amino acid transporter, y+ system), member 12 n=1 Tax=Rattus norvegicus TaxID=10116 RepID=Q6AYR7_RAT|nr:solute carrier family 7 (cationic amino acid transporter, y+ system), member 12 [Rattus norvegicus]AAH78940.1 Solute carrier family 7 (cationic amino acid transporter, y+ system), member 12 [Rattus norvegicus]|eukprot:NP_001011948.1 solute carrier family 7 (cationic amino acid transporter, y+ system), member 12 [Rattus norvegicus]